MSNVIRALVACEGGIDPDYVQASLPMSPDIQVVGIVEGFEDTWNVLQETETDLLIVACAGSSDRALFLIDGAAKQQRERPIVVLCEGSSNGFVRRAFEAGADDFVTLPDSPDGIRFALQKAVARRQGLVAGGSVSTAPLICILGPKGGTGKTLTACNLAVALAQADKRVAVVDLDLQFGDVGLSLGLGPERTIYDLAKTGGSIDAEKVASFLTRHVSGIDVLLAPTRPDHAGLISVDFLRDLYAALRTSHDYVVVDTPPGFTPEVIASIDSSSHVCVVAMLDSLSLKNTKLGLETLDLMGYDKAKVRLVLNRADSRVGITNDDVAAIIGRAPNISVPSDREIPLSVNEATPIVMIKQRAAASNAFRELARLYLDEGLLAEAASNGHKAGRKSLLRRSG